MQLRTVRTDRVGIGAGLATFMLLALLALCWQAPYGAAQDKDKGKEPDKSKGKTKAGLILNESGACKGYTLIASMNSRDVHLIDMEGRVVNTWKCDCNLGSSAYLLENGNLLRTGQGKSPPQMVAAYGGRIQEYSWDSKLVWDYTHDNAKQTLHHDICRLPNGNVLAIAAEKIEAKDAVAAGRRPETVKGQLMADCVVEIKPTGKTTGKVVWQWRAWDHLVQEFDKAKDNFGEPGKHPQKIDVNFGENTIASMVAKPDELKKLQALGYVGGTDRKPRLPSQDWLHVNAVAYNAELDQVVISVHEFSEIWVIDHSTTTEEAATEKGGKSGKGGGLLYRWGNPRAYRAGGVKDQQLFGQHNPQWIPKGYPGEGNILIFNNGMRRTGGAYSSVDEIVTPRKDKIYEIEEGKAYGPDKPTWSYSAPKRTDFYAMLISGAQRLSNGNTLICSGTNGTLFEVTPKKETVWKFVNPGAGGGFGPGPFPTFGPPKTGQVLPTFVRDVLKFTDEQKKDLDEVEKGVGEKLEKLLTKEQKAVLKEPPNFFRPGGMPKLGQLLADAVVEKMKLTDEQKKEFDELQKDADAKLDKLLKDDQKKQLKDMREAKGPPKMIGPPMGGGGGGPGGNGLFRAPRYEVGFAGLPKEIKPGKLLEEIVGKGPPKEPKDKK